MKDKLKGVFIAIAAVAVLAVGGTAIAGAAGGGDDDATDKAISGQALDRASSAALAETGGGKVSETEVGDEEGAYEVEVTRADGSQVDVHLDKGFNVLSSVGDNDGSGEKDGPNDD
ncbi:MAG TPA: PepSY domain-containing protein [Thermoleophilaceae bacterium]|jgi:uncharacterized membrane protein YkoI|nr:PepSY domain-containing protein [Thermoleophilaceae bacterium]